jgi:hypothetical protein
MIEILEQLVALEKIPIFSGEEAILPNGSIPDSIAQEKIALQELDSRFKINPLWRRVDQEHTWLCALCGLEVEDVRFKPGTGPGPAALRNVRRHLLAECMAWRAGRQQPLPASVLDQFLAEVNARKAGQEAEKKKKLARRSSRSRSRERHAGAGAERRLGDAAPAPPDPRRAPARRDRRHRRRLPPLRP